MNPNTLATALIRIVAIYGLADAADNVTYTLQWVFFPPQNATSAEVAFLGAALVARVCAFIALLIFAPQLGRFAFRAGTNAADQWPSGGALERAALFLLGCYLLSITAIDAARLLGRFYLYEGYALRIGRSAFAPQIQPSDFAQICAAVVKLALGLAFVFFSRGIVALKDRILALRD